MERWRMCMTDLHAHNGRGLERVAVVRALNGLGDMLCVAPALRALRSALPESRISLVGLSSAEWFVRRFDEYLDELIEFPGFPGIPEGPSNIDRLPDFLTSMHDRQFDLALQMHGSGITSNPFTTLLNARRTAGFFLPGQFCPNQDLFFSYPAHKPEICRWIELVERLGCSSQGQHLAFPLVQDDRKEFYQLQERFTLHPEEYICLHPGAAEASRQWPPEYFAAVGDALSAEGFEVVITGTAEETAVTQAVIEEMQIDPVDLTGETSLGGIAALLDKARLLVANDTGVSHLAAAVETPSVIVFLASDPRRWAPLNDDLHRAVGDPYVGQKCHHCDCVTHHRCLRDSCRAVRKTGDASRRSPPAVHAVLEEARDLTKEQIWMT